MCWNLPVSISFSVLYTACILFYYAKKPRYWRLYILFSGFYLIMEMFQSLQWIFGDVIYKDLTFGPEKCSFTNKSFTYFAYVLIWLQPLLFSIIGYLQDRNKFLKKIIILNIIVFCYSLVSVFVRLYHTQKYLIEGSNFAGATCTHVGPTHHLSWRFAVENIDLALNNMTYVILCTFSFLFYREELKNIWKGWVVTLLITKLVLNPHNAEVPSTWCLISVIANIIIILGAKYDQ